MTNNEAGIVQRLKELSAVLKEAEFRAMMGWGDQTAYLISHARVILGDIVTNMEGEKGKR